MTKLGKGAKVILILLFIGMIGNIFDGNSDDQSSEVQIAGVETSGVQKAEVTKTPVETRTPEPVVTETPEKQNTISLEDAMEEETPVKDEKEELEEEYRARLEEQEAEEAPENEETLEETPTSGTKVQFPESKKEELIEFVKEYSGSDEVEVLYIPPTESSSTGLMMVSYYFDFPPSKDKLEDDLNAIVLFSRQIAEKSGITNTGVNAVAMLRDGTGLGLGNYYASTGKTDILVQP